MFNIIERIPFVYLYAQIILVSFVLLCRISKKSLYLARMLACLSISVIALYLIKAIDNNMLSFIITEVFVVATLVICYDINIIHAVAFGTLGYAFQNSAFIICSLLLSVFDISLDNNVSRVLELVMLILLAALSYLFLARTNLVNKMIKSKNIFTIIISVLSLFIVIILHAEIGHEETEFVARLLCLISVILVVFLLFGIYTIDNLKSEKADIEHILETEAKLHRLSREKIEHLNITLHDLNHRIETLKKMGHEELITDEEKETAGLLNCYMKTGNPDLDIVITEKYIICEKEKIVVSSIIDGALLAFLKPNEIYSLFGNAMDNAIEYLSKVDENYRHITIRVTRQNNYVAINIENYCDREYERENGMPVTTKTDSSKHGYGLKSIKYIVERYNGIMDCDIKNNIFALNILFPLDN